jgi:hypothetical protein
VSDAAPHRKPRYAAAFGVLAIFALLAYALARHGAPPPHTLAPAEPGRVTEEPEPAEAPLATANTVAPEVATSAPAVTTVTTTELDEDELMRRLRLARGSNAEAAVELAREGNRRFPSSSAAPERASILIHSLAELGLASQARGQAEDMVNRYADSPWVREIENFTGAHRHRNVRVDDEGQLSFIDPPSPR